MLRIFLGPVIYVFNLSISIRLKCLQNMFLSDILRNAENDHAILDEPWYAWVYGIWTPWLLAILSAEQPDGVTLGEER